MERPVGAGSGSAQTLSVRLPIVPRGTFPRVKQDSKCSTWNNFRESSKTQNVPRGTLPAFGPKWATSQIGTNETFADFLSVIPRKSQKFSTDPPFWRVRVSRFITCAETLS